MKKRPSRGPLSRTGRWALVAAALALASCTAILGDGEYYVPSSTSRSDASVDDGSADGGVTESGETADAATCGFEGTPPCNACMPGTRRCLGKGVQTCSTEGQWVASSTAVPYVCTAPGVCAGACVVGSTQCAGKGVQNATPAARGRTRNRVRLGARTATARSTCVPGETQCSGVVSQTCDNGGTWQTTTTCPFVCTGAGTCSGVCAPGATQCSSTASTPTPQTCDATGAWDSGAPCAQPSPDCQGGACTCIEALCAGSCVNFQTDGHNCGSCAHDCQGQACQAGVCQPVALASSQGAPFGIAVGSQIVSWTNTSVGTVKMVLASGTGTVTTLASGQNDPMGIAVDGVSVYWVSYAKAAATSGVRHEVRDRGLRRRAGAPRHRADRPLGRRGRRDERVFHRGHGGYEGSFG